MEQPIAVSGVLIVRDEALRVVACIEALVSAVDEVVVADTGSSDDTAALAARAGARVVFYPWADDFSAARNYAASMASHDWILQVDADETLLDAPAARSLLQAFTASASPDTLGMVTLNNLTAGGEAVYQRSPRMYHRAWHQFQGRIHEQLVPLRETASVADTGLRLLHTGYALEPEALRAKCDRNQHLIEVALGSAPGDAYLWFQSGKCHFLLENHLEARRCFEKAFSLLVFDGDLRPRDQEGLPLDDDTVLDLLTSLAYTYCRMDQPIKAIGLLRQQEALGHPAAQRPDLPHALGYALIQIGDSGGAWEAYSRAIDRGSATEQVRGTATFASFFHLGLLCEARKQITDAYKFYLLALQWEPGHQATLSRCVSLIVEHGILIPEPVFAIADREALVHILTDGVLGYIQSGNQEAGQTLLCAAREMSEDFYRACVAVLQHPA